MPSKSGKQHRFFEMIAHDPKRAKELGVPQSVGKDFVDADKGKHFTMAKRFGGRIGADPGLPRMGRGARPPNIGPMMPRPVIPGRLPTPPMVPGPGAPNPLGGMAGMKRGGHVGVSDHDADDKMRHGGKVKHHMKHGGKVHGHHKRGGHTHHHAGHMAKGGYTGGKDAFAAQPHHSDGGDVPPHHSVEPEHAGGFPEHNAMQYEEHNLHHFKHGEKHMKHGGKVHHGKKHHHLGGHLSHGGSVHAGQKVKHVPHHEGHPGKRADGVASKGHTKGSFV